MKKPYLLIPILFTLACNLTAPRPQLTATTLPSLPVATNTLKPSETPSPVPTVTLPPIASAAWTSEGKSLIETAGLVIIIWELQAEPVLDPLRFVTKDGTIHTRQEMGYGEHLVHNFIEGSSINMWAMLGEKKLVAAENYSQDSTQSWVTVSQNDQEIYRIDTGRASPIPALRELWTLDNHWFLETNLYTDDASYHGQLTQDGLLLNNKNGYEEAFNFQALSGKPFYLFKRNGKINAWYAEQEIPLGYDLVPHYYCCSQAQLNPMRWTTMQAFFATRGETWYFVQIGLPKILK